MYSSVRKALRKHEFSWRYIFNLSTTVRHRVFDSEALTEPESRIVRSLKSDGIAVTSAEELFPNQDPFEELVSETQKVLHEKADEIEDLRSQANDESSIGSKSFNYELLGSEPVFDPKSAMARIALNSALLRVADHYFRMCVKLRYYNVWETFASTGASRESQLWHVDREDNRILKVFLYLDDVDEGTGPFTYAIGTQMGGRNRSVRPDSFLESGVSRTTDEQMKAVLPESEWLKCTGKRGTLILADTAGYHKGGEARTKDRLMFTCMYTSPASESKRLLKYPSAVDVSDLGPRQARALHLSQR